MNASFSPPSVAHPCAPTRSRRLRPLRSLGKEQVRKPTKSKAKQAKQRALKRILAVASRSGEGTPTTTQQEDKGLKSFLLKCGSYYQSAELFYQRQWRQRLRQIGFRVISVKKMDGHHLWEIRLCCNLSAQSYLLLSKPVPKKLFAANDLLECQIKAEFRLISKDLGLVIKNDEITVTRNGAHMRVGFLWPKGRAGVLRKKEKRIEAFPFLIRRWLRRVRN